MLRVLLSATKKLLLDNTQAECQGYSDCNTQAECRGYSYCNTQAECQGYIDCNTQAECQGYSKCKTQAECQVYTIVIYKLSGRENRHNICNWQANFQQVNCQCYGYTIFNGKC